jgi:ABC-type uncharacterized transport system permease subunit
MRATWNALSAAFTEYWLESARISEAVYVTASQVGAVAVFAWLARTGGRSDVITAIAFGVVLMVMWRASVFRLGFLVVGANNQGTLELEMMSATPIFWIMLGKTLAAFMFYGLIGVLCFGVVIVIGAGQLVVASPLLVGVSFMIALTASVSIAYIFAPLTFLAGGQAGFFNAIFPIGIALSGFVQPVGLLPRPLEWVARVLPTAWATESMAMALAGADASSLLPRWAVAIALTLGVFALSAWMFVRCEYAVRARGTAL